MFWTDHIQVFNSDCLESMKHMDDNEYDLAIVDPPYFSGPEKRKFYGPEQSKHGVKRIDYKPFAKQWTIPTEDYYVQLVRVSKNQIIWGINYFNFAGEEPGRIIWDKCNEQSSYSDCEIASCSLIKTVKIFRYMWNGMMQGSKGNGAKMEGRKQLNEKKIHPTQKPIQLYKWLLNKYANPGDSILDTHLGSGSSAIACHEQGFTLTGYEIDKQYCQAAHKRFKEITSQTRLYA